MMVVSDIEDVFVPLVDGFLVSPQEARSVVDRFVLLTILSLSLLSFIYSLFFVVIIIIIFFFWVGGEGWVRVGVV